MRVERLEMRVERLEMRVERLEMRGQPETIIFDFRNPDSIRAISSY